MKTNRQLRTLLVVFILLTLLILLGCEMGTSSTTYQADDTENTLFVLRGSFPTVDAAVRNIADYSAGAKASSAETIASVLLVYKDSYQSAPVINGEFALPADKREPAGLIFVGEEDSYLGHLTLGNGLDSLPLHIFAHEQEVNLNQITVENGRGSLGSDPFTSKLTTQQRTALVSANSYFSIMMKNPDIDGNGKVDILENKWAMIGLTIFPMAQGYEKVSDTEYQGVVIKAPIGSLTLQDPRYEDTDSVIFNPLENPEVGTYTLEDGNAISLQFDLSDILATYDETFIFAVPKAFVDERGNLERIEWNFQYPKGTTLTDNPGAIISNLEITIECSESALDKYEVVDGEVNIYRSPKLESENFFSGTGSYTFTKDILWTDVWAITFSPKDVYQNDYLYGFVTMDDGQHIASSSVPDPGTCDDAAYDIYAGLQSGEATDPTHMLMSGEDLFTTEILVDSNPSSVYSITISDGMSWGEYTP